ncbi:hypothetical protein NC653_009961 [Populus alba x Populus x berolinensis]|uniref:Uncharacterized protein n=1 Tax=Populus alba x Populus x berolinensis TaxID=444605 RepID=A0AAD6WAI5_9ROSI|nr:hypothetical protein NC653_009961 [Populus alba x Populus x berolinensis]
MTYPWTKFTRDGSLCPRLCFWFPFKTLLANAFTANFTNRNRSKLSHSITLHFHDRIVQNQSPHNLFNMLICHVNIGVLTTVDQICNFLLCGNHQPFYLVCTIQF